MAIATDVTVAADDNRPESAVVPVALAVHDRRAMIRTWLAAAPLAIALAACGDNTEAPPADDVTACSVQGAGIYIHSVPRADLLIVLDRTASTAGLDELIQGLASDWNGWGLDLHIAVITSELGAAVTGCDAQRTAPVIPDTTRCGLDRPYLDTARLTGSFADTLGCLLDVPATTCPVSQPLAAALAALDSSDAPLGDFRRPDRAYLGVVIVTDGDDCSLVDPSALQLPAGASEADVDFACFARGTVCDGDDPAAPGAHTGCHHRAGGGLIDPVATQALLTALGGDAPGGVTVIAGGDQVVVEGGHLAPACPADQLDAGPAPRLRSIENQSGSYWLEACWPGWDALGYTTLGWFKMPLGLPCLDPAIDRAPELPGVQAECAVTAHGLDGAERATLPACDDPQRDRALPCWEFDTSFPGCQDGALPFFIRAGDEVIGARWATIECATSCEL